jgi:hypothetical protein
MWHPIGAPTGSLQGELTGIQSRVNKIIIKESVHRSSIELNDSCIVSVAANVVFAAPSWECGALVPFRMQDKKSPDK